MGAFHYAKDSENFGRNSNGKVRFGFFWPEYSGSPLEVVHIIISVGIFRPKFGVPFLTNRFFALIREFGRRIWNDKSHLYWLAQFNRKKSFHFTQVFPLISDQSVWQNGKHPCSLRVINGNSIVNCKKKKDWKRGLKNLRKKSFSL